MAEITDVRLVAIENRADRATNLDVLDLIREVRRLRTSIRTVADIMNESIQTCCGPEAGKTFCEMYGCGTLMKYRDELNAALAAKGGGNG